MKRVYILVLILPLISAATTAHAGTIADFIATAHAAAAPSQPAAQLTLQSLEDLAADAASRKTFGLPAVTPPHGFALGGLQPVFMVRLDTLKSYNVTNDDDSQLQPLTDARRVLYLVDAQGPVVSVEVTHTSAGKWISFRLGQPNYTALVVSTLNAIDRSPDQTIIVEVPALQLRFIGFAAQTGTKETLMLASMTDAPEFKIAKYVPHPAREVLLALVRAAQVHNGNPT